MIAGTERGQTSKMLTDLKVSSVLPYGAIHVTTFDKAELNLLIVDWILRFLHLLSID